MITGSEGVCFTTTSSCISYSSLPFELSSSTFYSRRCPSLSFYYSWTGSSTITCIGLTKGKLPFIFMAKHFIFFLLLLLFLFTSFSSYFFSSVLLFSFFFLSFFHPLMDILIRFLFKFQVFFLFFLTIKDKRVTKMLWGRKLIIVLFLPTVFKFNCHPKEPKTNNIKK